MKIEDVFSDVLNVPAREISDDSSPKTISAWDSLRHVELIMAVESAFGVSFSVPEISTINSVRAVKQLLTQKGVAA